MSKVGRAPSEGVRDQVDFFWTTARKGDRDQLRTSAVAEVLDRCARRLRRDARDMKNGTELCSVIEAGPQQKGLSVGSDGADMR